MLAVMLTQGCGGDGSPDRPTFDDTAASTQVSRDVVNVVSHNYADAGTYTLTVTGQYTVTSFTAADRLAVWFAFSGQGTAAVGPSEPTYALP
jgi:hypothetical protein